MLRAVAFGSRLLPTRPVKDFHLQSSAHAGHTKKGLAVVHLGAETGDDFPGPKLMELPGGYYAAHFYDQVLREGRQVGISTYPVYSANERAWISLAMVDQEAATVGSKLNILWGEKNGGTNKPHVEQHRQTEIRAEVNPWPIHEASRRQYRLQA